MIRKSLVRWADGTYDGQRNCIECGLEHCKFPVYVERYKEIITKKSYWNWIEENMPTANGGTEEYREPNLSNPDILPEKVK